MPLGNPFRKKNKGQEEEQSTVNRTILRLISGADDQVYPSDSVFGSDEVDQDPFLQGPTIVGQEPEEDDIIFGQTVRPATVSVPDEPNWQDLDRMPIKEANLFMKRFIKDIFVTTLDPLMDAARTAKDESNILATKAEGLEEDRKEWRSFALDITRALGIRSQVTPALEKKGYQFSPKDVRDPIMQSISALKEAERSIKEKTYNTPSRQTRDDTEDMGYDDASQSQSATPRRSEWEVPVPDQRISLSNDSEDDDQDEDEPTYPSISLNEERPMDVEKKPDRVQQKEENTDSFFDEDIEMLRETMEPRVEQTLRTIAETGKSAAEDLWAEPDIYNCFKNQRPSFNASLGKLVDLNLLSMSAVKVSMRGTQHPVYELTEEGKAYYRYVAKKEPVKSELRVMIAQHDSLDHGFFIRTIAKLREKAGYTVYRDRESCTFKGEIDGKPVSKVFDLVEEKDGVKIPIECELGTHSAQDFYDAMDRAFAVTENGFRVICPSRDIMTHVVRLINGWISEHRGGRAKVKGLRLWLGTGTDLQSGDEKKVWQQYKID